MPCQFIGLYTFWNCTLHVFVPKLPLIGVPLLFFFFHEIKKKSFCSWGFLLLYMVSFTAWSRWRVSFMVLNGWKSLVKSLKCLGIFTEKLLFYVGISFICIQQKSSHCPLFIVEHQHQGSCRGWEGHLLIFPFQIPTCAHTHPRTAQKSSPLALCSAVGRADSRWKGRCANRQKIDPALRLSAGLKRLWAAPLPSDKRI